MGAGACTWKSVGGFLKGASFVASFASVPRLAQAETE